MIALGASCPGCGTPQAGAFFAFKGVTVVTVTGPSMLLTRAQAAEVAGVSVERIRTWERRKHLERAGLNEAGAPVYTALDVAKAQHKLREFTRVAA